MSTSNLLRGLNLISRISPLMRKVFQYEADDNCLNLEHEESPRK